MRILEVTLRYNECAVKDEKYTLAPTSVPSPFNDYLRFTSVNDEGVYTNHAIQLRLVERWAVSHPQGEAR